MSRQVQTAVRRAILPSAYTHDWKAIQKRLRRRRIAFWSAIAGSALACLMSLLVLTGSI